MISIRTSPTLLGVQTTHARNELTTQKSQMLIHQNYPKMEMESQKPRVLIDQYPCRATSGLKNQMDLGATIAQEASANAQAVTADISAKGDILAAIENKGNPLADFAEASQIDEHEFGMVTMPSQKPNIDVVGYLNIRLANMNGAQVRGAETKFINGKLDIKYIPGNVEIYVKQKGEVKIDFTPEKRIDIKL